MLRTKLAKKVLIKDEQKHLSEMEIHTMSDMKRQISFMEEYRPCCLECKTIAKKIRFTANSSYRKQ